MARQTFATRLPVAGSIDASTDGAKANTRNAMIATHDFCRRNSWRFYATAVKFWQGDREWADQPRYGSDGELYAYGLAKGASLRPIWTD